MGTTIKSIAVIVVLFASASSASAQLPTTTILGTVRDSGAGVMPGVTLGEGCVVGAHAVVTHSFDAGSVVAGVPARLVRTVSRQP